jgi:hypothetical protein
MINELFIESEAALLRSTLSYLTQRLMLNRHRGQDDALFRSAHSYLAQWLTQWNSTDSTEMKRLRVKL